MNKFHILFKCYLLYGNSCNLYKISITFKWGMLHNICMYSNIGLSGKVQLVTPEEWHRGVKLRRRRSWWLFSSSAGPSTPRALRPRQLGHDHLSADLPTQQHFRGKTLLHALGIRLTETRNSLQTLLRRCYVSHASTLMANLVPQG